jgi:hypothetical protein
MSDPRTKAKESKQYHQTKGFENQPDPHHVDLDIIKKDAKNLETLDEKNKEEHKQKDIK